MSFTYNGQTWAPQTTQQHANAIMDYINAQLKANNVTDSSGNVIQLTANFANALYLLVLGSGNVCADYDTKLTSAINSFTAELCDDNQIRNILPIAAITQFSGTYSTIVLTCTASADGPCTIPAGTKAPFGTNKFVTQSAVTISAGSSADILAVCDTVGPVVVLTGEITAFENVITNLATVINNQSSTPGKSAQTVNDLRKQIIAGNTIKYTLDGCIDAIGKLSGINYARIYFNNSTSDSMTLSGGVVLLPRHAYIVIYGTSDLIASTYAEYMNAPTQNGGSTVLSQDYTTASGQTIPIYYDNATETPVHIQITLNHGANYGDQVINQLKTDLIAASTEWNIGEALTSLATGKPFIDISYTSVAYTKVSLDGTTWADIITIGANVLPTITDSNITVVQL